MGDIPDVSGFLKHIPRKNDPRQHHNEHTVKFALELDRKRKENESMNAMIASTVDSMSKKVKLHLGKMGAMSRKLVESKDELQSLKASLLLPSSLHQTRVLSFSLQLSCIDATNPKVLSAFIRNKIPSLFGIPRMHSGLVMIERTPGKIDYLRDGDSALEEEKYIKLVDEIIANKQTVRRVYTSKEHPLDVLCVPIFSVSEEVIGALMCIVAIEDNPNDSLGLAKTFTIEDELTMFCFASSLAVVVNVGNKSNLQARLAVEDQVRRLYESQAKATEISAGWKAVAEAACLLSDVRTEEEICGAGSLVRQAIKGDDCMVFLHDDAKGVLWGEGTGADKEGGIGEEAEVQELMIKVLENGETITMGGGQGDARQIVGCAAKDEVGRVVGVVRVLKKGVVDVEKGVVRFIGKESIAVLEFLSTLVGQAIVRVRDRNGEVEGLREGKEKAEGELNKLKAKEQKKRVGIEHKMFLTAKDSQHLKGELMRCKQKLKKMEKAAESHSARREKAERMLEKVKRECTEVIGNLRKATKRKNEETKAQVERQISEAEALVAQNHELGKENDKLRETIKKMTKENEALKHEKVRWEGAKRDFELVNEKVSRLLVGSSSTMKKVLSTKVSSTSTKKSTKKKASSAKKGEDDRTRMRLKTPRRL